LLELGHKRIAFLSGPQAAPWSQERFEGYRRALREANLDVDEKLVFQAGRTLEDGAKAACQLINEAPDATAVQAVNDLVAIGCADTLLKQGLKVPDDVSIIGFGNVAISEYFRVPLTTMNQPKFRPGSKRLPADLIVRSSSGTPPAAPRFRQFKAVKNEAVV
jgi:DNA-binding LacI/PurR family transcriptional regulator